MNTLSRWPRLALVLAMTTSAVSAEAQVLLRDDFNGTGNVDTSVWRLPFGGPGSFVGRTQFRGDPSVDIPQQGIAEATASDGLVGEIHLDTFSPIDPGNQFLGTDLLTRRNFARGGGLSFEGRIRLAPGAPGGLVNGLFLFDTTRNIGGPDGPLVRDEIDIELVSNQTTGPAPTQDVLTNVFNDVGFTGPESAGNGAFVDVEGIDLTQFQDYRVDWSPQAVRWYVNDRLVRIETEDVPDDPQNLHFNLWAPDSVFESAFNAALQPAATEAENQRFTAQIDHVEVSRFNTAVSDNLLANAGFEDAGITDITTVPAGTTPTGEWIGFGNVGTAIAGGADNLPGFDVEGLEGIQVATAFGPFNGGPDASGLFQNIVASPGQEFEASALAYVPSSDTIAGTENFSTLALSFLNSSGDVIEEVQFQPTNGNDFPLADGRDPNLIEDQFLEGVVNAIAPDGTAFARLSLFFIQLANEGGSVVFDDVSLQLLTEDLSPILGGDFNNDGTVNLADYALWRDNLGGDESVLNGAGDGIGGVDSDDYLLWVRNFGLVADSDTLAVAVPEPGSAVLLAGFLLAAGTATGRRRSN